MDYPKSTPSVGLVNGKFVDENPVNGSPGSLIPAVWGNAVTEELLNVVQAGGLEPAEAEHDQLLKAIRTIIQSSLPPEQIRTTLAAYGITDAYTKAEVEALFKNATALPVGAMMAFPKGVVPPGYLEVDGSLQSSATYPDLATYLGAAFNKGDEPAGYFRLPESRGEFLRGWDHGRGVDAGRAVGSLQKGTLTSRDSDGNGFTAVVGLGAAPGTVAEDIGGDTFSKGGFTYPKAVVAYPAGSLTGLPQDDVYLSITRPRNLSVMWCIKAWSTTVNQGDIDIAELVAQVQNLQKIASAGAYKGLIASASGLNSLVNIAVDQLVVGNGTLLKSLSAVSLSINCAVAGANGLDSGTLAASNWYSVWVIWSNANGVAGLLSLSANAPTLPSGYTHKARIGWIRTDTTANKYPLKFSQVGRRIGYVVTAGTNVVSYPTIASGVASPAVAASISGVVPPSASLIKLTGGTTSGQINVSPSAAFNSAVNQYLSTSYLTAAPIAGGYNASGPVTTIHGELLIEGAAVMYGSTATTGILQCMGWEDNL